MYVRFLIGLSNRTPSSSSSPSFLTVPDTLWRAWCDIGGALSNSSSSSSSSSSASASGGPLGPLPWTKSAGGNGASTDNQSKLKAELREAQSAVVAASQRLAKAEVVHETAVAKRIECLADVEDAHEAKRSLCRQLTHVLQAHEGTKYSRMLSGSVSVLLGAAGKDGKWHNDTEFLTLGIWPIKSTNGRIGLRVNWFPYLSSNSNSR